MKDASDHEICWEIILGEWKITKKSAFLFQAVIHFPAEIWYFSKYSRNAPDIVSI